MTDPLIITRDALLAQTKLSERCRTAMHSDPSSIPLAMAYAHAADAEATLRERYEEMVVEVMARERASLPAA